MDTCPAGGNLTCEPVSHFCASSSGFKVLKGLDYKGAVVATMMMDKSKKEDAFKKGQAPPKANAPPQPASSAARPSTSTPTPAAKPTPSPTSKLGPQPPKYSITERGHVDLGDYMMADPLGPKSTRPKELLIKIELPLVVSEPACRRR